MLLKENEKELYSMVFVDEAREAGGETEGRLVAVCRSRRGVYAPHPPPSASREKHQEGAKEEGVSLPCFKILRWLLIIPGTRSGLPPRLLRPASACCFALLGPLFPSASFSLWGQPSGVRHFPAIRSATSRGWLRMLAVFTSWDAANSANQHWVWNLPLRTAG